MTIKSDIKYITKSKENNSNNYQTKKFDRHKKNLYYDREYVYSYGTKVGKIDWNNKTLTKLGYWSMTTSTHLNYAGQQLGLKVVNNLK